VLVNQGCWWRACFLLSSATPFPALCISPRSPLPPYTASHRAAPLSLPGALGPAGTRTLRRGDWRAQTLKFVAPVAVGATVTAQVEVLKLKRLGGNVVAMWKTTCTAAPRGGEPPRALIEGQALCRLPS